MTPTDQQIEQPEDGPWSFQESTRADGDCYYLFRNGAQIVKICGPQEASMTRQLKWLIEDANASHFEQRTGSGMEAKMTNQPSSPMSDADLCDRLRYIGIQVVDEAADAIERLTAEKAGAMDDGLRLHREKMEQYCRAEAAEAKLAETVKVIRDMLAWADTPSEEASPSWIIGACNRARHLMGELS